MVEAEEDLAVAGAAVVLEVAEADLHRPRPVAVFGPDHPDGARDVITFCDGRLSGSVVSST